jgi:capsular polysaccharide biosynthesis protein
MGNAILGFTLGLMIGIALMIFHNLFDKIEYPLKKFLKLV